MTVDLMTTLQAELSRLRAQLEDLDIYKDIQALERVIRISAARSFVPNLEQPVHNEGQTNLLREGSFRTESPTSSRLKAAAIEVLSDSDEPMATRDLHSAIIARDVRVPGGNPTNNLSAHLSRDARFVSFGRDGWMLASKVLAQLQQMEDLAIEYVKRLSQSDLEELGVYWQSSDGLPQELDRTALQFARGHLGRSLLESERQKYRSDIKLLVSRSFVPNSQV